MSSRVHPPPASPSDSVGVSVDKDETILRPMPLSPVRERVPFPGDLRQGFAAAGNGRGLETGRLQCTREESQC